MTVANVLAPNRHARRAPLPTSRLYHRNVREIGRKFVRFKILYLHLNQTDKWTPEIRFLISAPIDNYADGGNDSAMGADNVDRLLDSSAARHDVLGDDESFALIDLKSVTQSEPAGVFFDKDVPFA